MSLKSFWLDLLFPIECLGCHRPGDWICAACFRDLKFSGQDLATQLKTPDLERVFVAGDYDDPLLATAIKKFKYDSISALGPILARFLTMFWSGVVGRPGGLFSGPQPTAAPPGQLYSSVAIPPLLVPLPLSKKRERWRGFNQAEILARELSPAFAYPLSSDLKRIKHQKPQASLSGNERAQNIQGAFTWAGENLSGRTIILVDDVITTGATLNEAARVLKEAGAARIYGLVLAKG